MFFFFFNFRRHHLSRRRVIPLPKTKANPITHPQALFQKDQVSGKLKCKVTHKMCVSNAMFVHITLFLIGCGREWGFTKFLICFTKKEFQQKLLRWQLWKVWDHVGPFSPDKIKAFALTITSPPLTRLRTGEPLPPSPPPKKKSTCRCVFVPS